MLSNSTWSILLFILLLALIPVSPLKLKFNLELLVSSSGGCGMCYFASLVLHLHQTSTGSSVSGCQLEALWIQDKFLSLSYPGVIKLSHALRCYIFLLLLLFFNFYIIWVLFWEFFIYRVLFLLSLVMCSELNKLCWPPDAEPRLRSCL